MSAVYRETIFQVTQPWYDDEEDATEAAKKLHAFLVKFYGNQPEMKQYIDRAQAIVDGKIDAEYEGDAEVAFDFLRGDLIGLAEA